MNPEYARSLPSDPPLLLREVGLRDGLQISRGFPSTEAKKRWIAAAHAAGITQFEVGSFLPASRFPQFADLPEIAGFVASLPRAQAAALVLNERGIAPALASPIAEIGCVVSATESHSLRNARRSRAQAVALVGEACAARDADRPDLRVSAGIAMAFGCSIDGRVEPREVLGLVEQLLEAGIDMIGLADTVGHAGPDQVAALVEATRRLAGSRPLNIHLHDTRGLGLANAAAAIDAGVRMIDASSAGLGGCPFAPGATGNIVLEDLAFLCRTKGIETGIDIEALRAIRAIIADAMPEEPLHGALARAGLPRGESRPPPS